MPVWLYNLPNSCIELLFGVIGAILFDGARHLTSLEGGVEWWWAEDRRLRRGGVAAGVRRRARLRFRGARRARHPR